jgi:hypothetical protein
LWRGLGCAFIVEEDRPISPRRRLLGILTYCRLTPAHVESTRQHPPPRLSFRSTYTPLRPSCTASSSTSTHPANKTPHLPYPYSPRQTFH